MSFQSEMPQMKSKNRIRRTAPSIRLKAMRPPSAGSIFFSSVAANSGRYLYMKMKKASERMIFPAASQLLRVAAFSREADLAAGGREGSDSLRFGGTGEAPVATWFV